MVDSSDSGSFCESHCSFRHFQMVIVAITVLLHSCLSFISTKSSKRRYARKIMTKTFQNCDIEIFHPVNYERLYFISFKLSEHFLIQLSKLVQLILVLVIGE